MKRGHFLAAFILLSLITVLLLVYSVQFFNAAPVRMQLSAWLNPPAASRSAQNASSRVEPGAALHPTFTPVSPQTQSTESVVIPLRHEFEQEQIKVDATPEPIFEVIEDPPPAGNLVIPSLGIDEPLVPIAVRDQVWDLENLGSHIGWLETTGSHPNDDLAMVLIGHITLPYPGGPGPFLKLSGLRTGDVIGYRLGQETYIYEVKDKAVVKPDQIDYLYMPNGKRLLLVTCTGYNALEWKYDLRLVVEAELVSIEK